MQSTLSKWLGGPLTCPTGSPIEEQLIRSSSGGGITLKMNGLLQEQLCDPLLKVKKHWAEDLAMDISPDDWKSCLNNINTMYMEMGNRFIQLKKIHRWHRMPQQLYKLNLIPIDYVCWRCDRSGASILHILWTCPALKDW